MRDTFYYWIAKVLKYYVLSYMVNFGVVFFSVLKIFFSICVSFICRHITLTTLKLTWTRLTCVYSLRHDIVGRAFLRKIVENNHSAQAGSQTRWIMFMFYSDLETVKSVSVFMWMCVYRYKLKLVRHPLPDISQMSLKTITSLSLLAETTGADRCLLPARQICKPEGQSKKERGGVGVPRGFTPQGSNLKWFVKIIHIINSITQ